MTGDCCALTQCRVKVELLCPRELFPWEAVLGSLICNVAGKNTHTIVPLIIIVIQKGNDYCLHITNEKN